MNAKTRPLFEFLDLPRALPAKRDPATRRQGFGEIYRDFGPAQAAAQASRCLACGTPYCSWKCPLHNAIPEWLALAAQERWFEAAELCHETNPLPEICGRVCPQDRLCEGTCTLNDITGAVTIGSAERHIVDRAFAAGWRPDLSRVKKLGKHVAVVGAGPAGLACADVLLRHGVDVTVYDRQDEIGGLLMFGIPEFKLEKRVLRQRREIFEAMGMRFVLGCELGRDVALAELEARHDAVFLGLGAEKPLSGGFSGEDLPGVHRAMDYLVGQTRALHGLAPRGPGHIDLKDKRVLVLGGGDTAMDCVRTALRQQAREVVCVYRRDEASMPGSRREVAHAKEEGARFLWHRQPLAIAQTAKGPLRLTLKITDGVETTEEMEADAILIAFGFRVERLDWLDLPADAQGRLPADAKTGQLSGDTRLYAGGDVVRGADLVVNAVADGRRAAQAMLETWLS
ncbi:MAG: glutamate synthase subunit beta [Gammaproteobacteria bacterium]|nr:glutamate synthase subunit beta [Gammaproteobacteria bacterium]